MNLARTLIVLTIGLIVSNNSFSQQEPRSAFFWNNYMHTNPAMTGAIYKHQANVQWRNQWVNTNGAPTTLWANYAAKLDKINSGIGISYEYDAGGVSKSQTALLSYAYHLPIRNMFLSFGASAGLKTMKIEGSDFIFSSQVPENPLFGDRRLGPVFQCDFGIALHGEKWNVGLSATQLNNAEFKDDSLVFYENVPHFWLFADYSFNLGEKWKLTPRLQSYMDRTDFCSTLALVASFKENLWFGCTTSIPTGGGIYSVGPMIGYDIVGKFRIGYTYEFWFSNSPGLYNDGTHEVILSYQLK